MKNRTKIFLSILVLLFIAGNVFLIKDYGNYSDKTFCGTVVNNFTELTNVKHGTNTEYFLQVEYNGKRVIEKVGPKTYYDRYKLGSKICLVHEYQLPFLLLILAALDWFIVGLICIVILFWIFGSPLSYFFTE